MFSRGERTIHIRDNDDTIIAQIRFTAAYFINTTVLKTSMIDDQFVVYTLYI